MKKLKLMAIAYEIANAYDCVPSSDKAGQIFKNYDFGTEEEIIEACDNYQGSSPRNMVDEIISEIKKSSTDEA